MAQAVLASVLVGLVVCLPVSATGESLVATRTIAAQSLLSPDDMALVDAVIPGALKDPSQAVGLQTRRAIYPGRPILARDLGAPVLVGRNALVRIRYQRGGLEIAADGRALEQGGAGEVIRVMSLGSKTVVSGRVMADGTINVGGVACAGC